MILFTKKALWCACVRYTQTKDSGVKPYTGTVDSSGTLLPPDTFEPLYFHPLISLLHILNGVPKWASITEEAEGEARWFSLLQMGTSRSPASQSCVLFRRSL